MKLFVRYFGVILVLGGIFSCCLSAKFEESAKPRRVDIGAIVDGETIITDTYHTPSNEESLERADFLNNLGITSLCSGAALFVGSLFIETKHR